MIRHLKKVYNETAYGNQYTIIKEKKMFILEELWNGELAPCERRFREGGEYDGLLRQLVELEDKLQRDLGDEHFKRIMQCEELKNCMSAIAESESFITGFRMGACMILDVMGVRKPELPWV